MNLLGNGTSSGQPQLTLPGGLRLPMLAASPAPGTSCCRFSSTCLFSSDCPSSAPLSQGAVTSKLPSTAWKRALWAALCSAISNDTSFLPPETLALFLLLTAFACSFEPCSTLARFLPSISQSSQTFECHKHGSLVVKRPHELLLSRAVVQKAASAQYVLTKGVVGPPHRTRAPGPGWPA